MKKIIVQIPTHNRPKILNLTLQSVAQQATDFKHNVEIVVSDSSSPENSGKNREFISKLGERFPKVPIHYYAPNDLGRVREALVDSTDGEKRAFLELVPPDGEFGANRNRLSLLAAAHGGKGASYLHLDDDTPLLLPDGKGGVKKNPEDVIGSFRDCFNRARLEGYAGYSAAYAGVIDFYIGGKKVEREPQLRQHLKAGQFEPSGHAGGPGRILGFEHMSKPYAPYGYGQDTDHAASLGADPYLSIESPAKLVHIGLISALDKRFKRAMLPHGVESGWERLMERVSRLGLTGQK